MGTKTKKTPTEQLQLLGKWQLGSYLVILLWLILFEIFAINRIDSGFGQNGWPVVWIPGALLGLLLIPSSVTFIQTGKRMKAPSTRSARILQIILFSIVLALTYPAFLLALLGIDPGYEGDGVIFTTLLAPVYFIACVLGLVSFPIMWKITRSLVPKKIKVPVDENQNLIKQ